MAVTGAHNVGRTRKRLAAILANAMPDVLFEPVDLFSENPHFTYFYGTAKWRGCGRLRDNSKILVNVFSWDTMTVCVKQGVSVSDGASLTDREVSAA